MGIKAEVYNWLLEIFTAHRQKTKFAGIITEATVVNSGVIRDSALGPIMLSIFASDLQPNYNAVTA